MIIYFFIFFFMVYFRVFYLKREGGVLEVNVIYLSCFLSFVEKVFYNILKNYLLFFLKSVYFGIKLIYFDNMLILF